MAGLGKRRANVPTQAVYLGNEASKADLLEAAWHLASLSNDAGSVDDDASTLKRLLEELNQHRQARGTRPLKLP